MKITQLLWIGIIAAAARFSTAVHLPPADHITPLTKAWEKPVPTQRVPQGLQTLSAEDCGACHEAIYAEWKTSSHSLALKDPQFQSEMKKDGVAVCLNCHTPLQNQLEYVITGWINGDYRRPAQTRNPDFDPSLRKEAITCAVCHVRDGNIIGPTGRGGDAHATKKDTAFLSATLCMTCHNVTDSLSAALVCTFETGDEWMRNAPHLRGRTCITCHMPDVKRSVTPDAPQRVAHVHAFPGSGIPKLNGLTVRALHSLDITADSIRNIYHPGDTLHYAITLKNAHAGHNVPTGDPERYFLVTMQLKDQEGAVVKTQQYRIGEEWQWSPHAKKLSDNNLSPGEVRSYAINAVIPSSRALTLFIEITKHRMSEENAKYDGLMGAYPLSVEVFTRVLTVAVH